jgi:hypothetical protein
MTIHREELARLGSSYSWALQVEVSRLVSLVDRMSGRPAIFIGSGGALAVARFAADLHLHRSTALALAATPLDSFGMPAPAERAGAVVLSARVSHPDVWLAVESAIKRNLAPVAVVTHRPMDEIAVPSAAKGVEIISLPTPMAKDGFLATNSVLTMVTMLVRSYSPDGLGLPPTLPSIDHSPPDEVIAHRCIVVAPPGYGAVALDLEARLSELGISCVQLTDYRNLAHGRHTGLAKRLHETTLIPIVAPRYASLATATLRVLPRSTHVVPLSTGLDWPIGVLDLLVASMKMAGQQAEYAKIDASRPGVPLFGRKLYHLPVHRLVRHGSYGPIERKLQAAGFPVDSPVRHLYDDALREWLELVTAMRFGGVVLDYDGTVNPTQGRTGLPSRHVQKVLLRCLRNGILLGFASGRGRSLYRDLREWVPERWWDRIHLGLYNGGARLTLADDEVPLEREPDQTLCELFERVRNSPVARFSESELGPAQVEVRAVSGSGVGNMMLRRWITELIAREPRLALRAVSSAHSVDVVPLSSAKVCVVEDVAKRCGHEVLTIGDQGQIDGNDFELLAYRRTSLSVDRCSGDPTRCWNLVDEQMAGPDALVRYLSALQRAGRTVRFGWT